MEYDGNLTHCPEDGRPLFLVGSREGTRVGERISEHLTLLELIGKGGFGEVYRAAQHTTGREVAVKLLKAEVAADAASVRRFAREARALTALDHPNVVTVFDVGQTRAGEAFLVMERLRGTSLRDLIRLGGALEADRALRIAVQVADALDAAHEAGIIHRDLTPSNVFVRPTAGGAADFVTVFDFGLARMAQADRTESWSSAGGPGGTPAYMSPEEALGDSIDHRTDLYSLGLLLFEMLTGRHPYGKVTGVAALLAHVNAPLPRIPEAPAPLRSVLLHLLAKEPSDRPATAAAARDALRAVRLGEAPALAKGHRRWPWVALAALACAVAGYTSLRQPHLVAVDVQWLTQTQPRESRAAAEPSPYARRSPEPPPVVVRSAASATARLRRSPVAAVTPHRASRRRPPGGRRGMTATP